MAMNVGGAFIFLMAIQMIRFGDEPIFRQKDGAKDFGKAKEAEYKEAVAAQKAKRKRA